MTNDTSQDARSMDSIDATTLFLLNVILALILAVYFIGYKVLIAFGLLGAAIGVPAVLLMFIDASGFFEWLRAGRGVAK